MIMEGQKAASDLFKFLFADETRNNQAHVTKILTPK